MRNLKEARTFSPIDRDILREAREVVLRLLPDAQVVLYGSVARGTQTSDSDYDILVLTEKGLTAREEDVIRDALYDVQLPKGIMISSQFCSRREWETPMVQVSPFYREVERDGVVL